MFLNMVAEIAEVLDSARIKVQLHDHGFLKNLVHFGLDGIATLGALMRRFKARPFIV